MMKKLFSSIMIGAMTLSLVACGSTEQQKASSASSSQNKNQEVSADVSKETPAETSSTVKEEEIVTLKCYMLGQPALEKDLEAVVEAMNEITREEIGAELDWVIIDGGSMAEKMNVIMASGEEFDVCFTGYCNKYANAAQNGGLYDITDLLAECPGIAEHVPDYAMDQCYVGGRLYGVPNMQVICKYREVVLQKSLVEKYNFDYESVEKLEDLEPFLQMVKENEPGIYPLGDDITATYVDRAFSDNYVSVNDVVAINVNTGEITSCLETPEYQAVVNRARDWYEKGYMRSDILSITSQDQLAAKKAGQVAAWVAVGKPGLATEIYNQYGFEVVTKQINSARLSAPTSTLLSVGANSKNPLKALQLIELLNTNEELHNLAVYGIEGMHYNLNADGKVELIEGSGYDQTAFNWALGDQFITKLMYNQDDDLWEVTKALNDSADMPLNTGFSIPSEIKDTYKTDAANISAVYGEYKDVLTYGVEDPDKVIPELQKRIEKSVDTIKKSIQPVVDEWIAKKNK